MPFVTLEGGFCLVERGHKSVFASIILPLYESTPTNKKHNKLSKQRWQMEYNLIYTWQLKVNGWMAHRRCCCQKWYRTLIATHIFPGRKLRGKHCVYFYCSFIHTFVGWLGYLSMLTSHSILIPSKLRDNSYLFV